MFLAGCFMADAGKKFTPVQVYWGSFKDFNLLHMWMAVEYFGMMPTCLLAQRYNTCVCVYNKRVVYTKQEQ